MRVCVQVGTEAEMSDLYGVGVRGSCEPPGVGAVLETDFTGLLREQSSQNC